MFKHCINLIEERVIYDLLDTPHKLRFLCCFMGAIINLFMHLCYNNLTDILTCFITPPWFGMYYWNTKTPFWIYCLTIPFAYFVGNRFGNWWTIVHTDIYINGRKRWCTKNINHINDIEVDFEQKKEN